MMREVAGHWKDLAIALHFDGPALDAIQADSHYRSTSACCEMFQRWMRGEGRRPVCWDVLLKALKDADFGELARKLSEALQQLKEH